MKSCSTEFDPFAYLGIPTMTEVERIPLNGLRVISLFSGAGGMDLGLRMAGFETIWANDMMPLARATYQCNHGDIYVDPRDIRQIAASEILEKTGLGAGQIDLIAGSPPCSSFSTSGKRSKGWGRKTRYSKSKSQRTDDLFFEFIRIIDGIKPKVFVAENVAGLTIAGSYFRDIIEKMRGCGYEVEAKLLDAQWLGVPQKRKRLFFIGVRHGLRVHPQFPRPQERRFFVSEVMPHVARFHISGLDKDRIPRGWRRATQDCFPTITDHSYRMSAQAVLASNARVILHDGTERRISLEELRLLFTFPRDFELIGIERDGWERIARSVPPFVARAIGQTLATRVFGELRG